MNEAIKELSEEMIIACKRAYQSQLQKDSGGNISARIGENAMLVKASGESFCCMDEKSFSLADYNGNKIGEGRSLTREALLHGYIYRELPKVNAVIHVHSPFVLTLSIDGKNIERASYQAQLKLKSDIPNLNINTPVVGAEELQIAGRCFCKEDDMGAFVLKNHGLVTYGKSVVEAESIAEFIEETAKVIFLRKLLKICEGRQQG